jgi:hypothetical protein
MVRAPVTMGLATDYLTKNSGSWAAPFQAWEGLARLQPGAEGEAPSPRGEGAIKVRAAVPRRRSSRQIQDACDTDIHPGELARLSRNTGLSGY